MTYNVYAIKDNKAGFLSPLVDANDDTAKRNFEHAIANPDSMYFTHANDFDLYKLGTFDTDSGLIVSFVSPEFIISGSSLKKSFDLEVKLNELKELILNVKA